MGLQIGSRVRVTNNSFTSRHHHDLDMTVLGPRNGRLADPRHVPDSVFVYRTVQTSYWGSSLCSKIIDATRYIDSAYSLSAEYYLLMIC